MTDQRRDKPNILMIQVDELVPTVLSFYGNKLVRTPNLDRLAARGVVFENAHCNYPLCSPSRASMMTGQLPFAIDQWDNGAEFRAEIPTFAHYLRAAGYSTTLCGKMHFIGPDQHHGFEERLVTDIYPSDFSWTADWSSLLRKGGGIRVRNVVEAGTCVRSLQMDYDDEVEFQALQKIYDLARDPDRPPFLLVTSFSHPHPPFVISQPYYDLYRHEEIDMPRVPAMRREELDPFSQARFVMMGHEHYDISDEHVRTARHAYYGMVSYVDEKIGRLLDALEATGLDSNTWIVFTSDHGEMLGERGMWLKDGFYDPAIRVPLVIAGPGVAPRRVGSCVSLVDLAPTFLELAGAAGDAVDRLDGSSLLGLIAGNDAGWRDEVIVDFAASGHPGPSRMIRRGRYKYVWHHGLPQRLFDIEADPDELHDLAGDPAHAAVVQDLHARLAASWDPDLLAVRIRESQLRRLAVQETMESSPRYSNWAAQVQRDDTRRFVRGRASAFYAKARLRFPYPAPVPPDRPLPENET